MIKNYDTMDELATRLVREIMTIEENRTSEFFRYESLQNALGSLIEIDASFRTQRKDSSKYAKNEMLLKVEILQKEINAFYEILGEESEYERRRVYKFYFYLTSAMANVELLMIEHFSGIF